MVELLDNLDRALLQIYCAQLVVAAEEVVISCDVALASLILHDLVVLYFDTLRHADYTFQSHGTLDVIEEQLEDVQRVVSYSDYLLVPLAENDLLELRAFEYDLFALRLLAYLLYIVHLIYDVAVVDVHDLELARFAQFHHELRAFQIFDVQVLVSDARTEV